MTFDAYTDTPTTTSTATSTPSDTPTPTLTALDAALQRARVGVTHNDDWQEFSWPDDQGVDMMLVPTGPLAGLKLPMPTPIAKSFSLTAVPPGVVNVIFPVVAPEGTIALSEL